MAGISSAVISVPEVVPEAAPEIVVDAVLKAAGEPGTLASYLAPKAFGASADPVGLRSASEATTPGAGTDEESFLVFFF